MTFSIVAVDRENKEAGFAIASCFWNAGQVGFAKADAGAIVSQARGNWSFIPLFFEKLEEKMSLEDILEHFRSTDEDFESRQVGMVSFQGDAVTFTGKDCFQPNQRSGRDYACQGNILARPEVIDRMAEAFENTEGSLAERFYSALQAGDDAGGDMRGKMSARVWVVKNRNNPLTDTLIDFTVEDHPEPVREIGRLIELRKNLYATWGMMEAASKLEGVEQETALSELESFLEDKVDRAYLDFHSFLAETYLERNQREKAIAAYRTVKAISPRMVELVDEEIRDAL
ncbi:MAG: DUF1028 domain-containing protein [Candidatus Thorarchaeota archaeon]